MDDRNHAPLFVWEKKLCAINHLPGQAGVVVHAEIVETKSPKKKKANTFHFLKHLIFIVKRG